MLSHQQPLRLRPAGVALAIMLGALGCGSVREDAPADADGEPSWRALGLGISDHNRLGHAAVRAADGIYVWGGETFDSESGGRLLADGWRVDIASNDVAAMNAVGAPSARSGHFATSSPDGGEVLVWGGQNHGERPWDGARYDCATKTWTPIDSTGHPYVRHGISADTNQGWFVWGEKWESVAETSAGVYSFANDRWTSVDATGGPSARASAAGAAVHSGKQIVIWGGLQTETGPVEYFGDGAIFTGDGWIPIEQDPALRGRYGHSLVYYAPTDEIIIWGGYGEAGAVNDGARKSVDGGEWVPLSMEGAPSPRHDHYALLLGKKMVVLGGMTLVGGKLIRHADGAIYDLESDRWEPLPAGDVPPHVAIGTFTKWSETQALLWGAPADLTDGLKEQGWVLTLPADEPH